jgi:CRP-like cAMP-binding protein
MLLKNIPLFSTISDDDLGRLSELLQTRNVAANQAIFWIGENGDELFIVQSGRVRLSYINENGQEITLAVVGSGAFFGDLSLLDGGPRTATAIAQSDSLLWVLKRAAFFNFLEGHPKVAQVMVSTLATRMRENMEKLKSIKNVNEEVDERITPLQKLVDKAADSFSSGRFLLANVVVFCLWMLAQTILVWRLKPELITFLDAPPSFFWLGFMVTSEALFLTVFVLNSQKRQAERDRIRGDFEYQVNLKAQMEIMHLHQKMDRLVEVVGGLNGKG